MPLNTSEIKYIKKVREEKKITYIEEVEVDYKGSRTVPIIRFEPFKSFDFINAGFSTRFGGVSEGIFESMNLSFSRSDDENKVLDNHIIMGKAFGVEPENLVYSYQTHTTNVLKITDENRGMGITRMRNFGEIDGFVTNVPGIMLITSYADCVPLYFVDPVNKAIGLSHSGWRGTVKNMAKATIDKMVAEYNTNPSEIIGLIGPSICRDCYEVGEDVATEFAAYSNGVVTPKQILPDGTKKFYLDLHEANRQNFLACGLKDKNIFKTDMCTCDKPQLSFSHRASKGLRGGCCGYMMTK